MRAARVAILGLAGCTGEAGTLVDGPPVTMSLHCTEAVRDAVPAGSDLRKIVAEALPGSTILVGPGAFRGPIQVKAPGIVLRGTCPAVTFIDSDGSNPGIQVFAPDAYIEQLTVRGGAPAIAIMGDTFGASIRDVVLDHPDAEGVALGGEADLLAENLLILDPRGRGVHAFGLAVANLTRTTIESSVELGVFAADGAQLTFRDGRISGTVPNASGALGRAVHAQHGAFVEVLDSVIEGNSDAAISAVDADLVVRGTRVSGTAPGPLGTGDGIAFFRGPDGPSQGTLTTSDVTLVDNARAGVIVDGVVGDVALFGGSISGGAYALVTQNEARLTSEGIDIESGLPSLEDLVGDAALPIDDHLVD